MHENAFLRGRALLLTLIALLAISFGCLPTDTAEPSAPGPSADAGDLDAGNPSDAGYTLDAGSEPDAGGQPVLDAGYYGPSVTFKVMTWNVHNLFDTVDDSYEDEVLTASQLGAKLDHIATVIRNNQPDVLALQEVEKESLLVQLNAKLGSSAFANYRLVPTYRDPRGINVAVMSRFPINVVSNASYYIWPTGSTRYYRFPRDCLEVHLDLGGNRKAVLLINHHTSMLSDPDGTERNAQSFGAVQIANHLRSQDPFLAVIIAGDMNSDEGTQPITTLLDGGNYVDIGMRVSASSRWTYEYDGDRQRLDYLMPDARAAAWVSNVTFIHGSDVDAASDHQPVRATFTFP
jgi:endonuclease/exonuclease/phosphatase family metal-dependent hydrolase